VLEDKFSLSGAAGRPPLDLLDNVIFVPDVGPYEFMKIRILNGGHASLCYPSALLDLHYVHESMEHPIIGAFLDALQRQEIIPTIPPLPNIDLAEYWQTVAKRFSNPTLRDTIPRICFDGASRQPKFIVGTIKDNIEKGRSIRGMALVSALWCRYCQGKTESGKIIPPNDPYWDRLQDLALRAMLENPRIWLDGLPDVYGAIVSPVFINAFELAFQSIQTHGVEGALTEYIASVK
jgi:mannitol 2-dehydrogenase